MNNAVQQFQPVIPPVGYAGTGWMPRAAGPTGVPGAGMPGQPLPNTYFHPMMEQPSPTMPFSTGPVMTPAGPLAQSFPLMPFNLTPPDQMAPCLFNNHVPYGQGYIPPGMTNFYNYNQSPYYPWANPQPGPPMSNPGAQPIGAQDKPPEKPEEKPPDKPIQPLKDVPRLTAELVQEVNAGLQQTSPDVRMMAAQKLSEALDNDPEVMSKPEVAPFAEALIVKALKDPNSMVRAPILMSMELGNPRQATPKMLATLRALRSERGMYNFEPTVIDTILHKYEMQALQPQEAQGMPQGSPTPAAAALARGGAPGAQSLAGLPRGAGIGNLPPEVLAALGQRGGLPIPPGAQALQGRSGMPGRVALPPQAYAAMQQRRAMPPGFPGDPRMPMGPMPQPQRMPMVPAG